VERGGYTYILMNPERTTLYVGVTSDLVARISEHKEGLYSNSFTKRYHVVDLLYYEFHDSIEEAIAREKQIKRWRSEWKMNQIRSFNPALVDLFPSLLEDEYGSE
jgi:putative endonuclease